MMSQLDNLALPASIGIYFMYVHVYVYCLYQGKLKICIRLHSVTSVQRYTYRVLQTIQMKLILLCVWAEPSILGSVKTALKFKYEI